MPSERALLISIQLDARFARGSRAWSLEDEAAELRDLVASTGGRVVGELSVKRHQPAAGTFLGTGKLEEIAERADELQAQAVIFNHELSSSQQRNIEDVIGVKTLDRTQVILDVFAQRAKSQEGKVQVELAQLRYLMPRLMGQGLLLSRQAGGIGSRGPGEQKLEMDRRRIKTRIGRLEDDLAQLQRRREAARAKRKETGVPVAALVGYTNAGKTTLLNRLTGAAGVIKYQLFTTLDPLARRMHLPSGETLILTDTVGFLHHLPHHLIQAFHATLEETADADVLLHVLDVSHPLVEEHARAVEEVLASLELKSKPKLTALNKCDRLADDVQLAALERAYAPSAAISAKTGQGIERLLARLDQALAPLLTEPVRLRIPADRAQLVAAVYQDGQVLQRRETGDAIELTARIPERLRALLSPHLLS